MSGHLPNLFLQTHDPVQPDRPPQAAVEFRGVRHPGLQPGPPHQSLCGRSQPNRRPIQPDPVEPAAAPDSDHAASHAAAAAGPGGHVQQWRRPPRPGADVAAQPQEADGQHQGHLAGSPEHAEEDVFGVGHAPGARSQPAVAALQRSCGLCGQRRQQRRRRPDQPFGRHQQRRSQPPLEVETELKLGIA